MKGASSVLLGLTVLVFCFGVLCMPAALVQVPEIKLNNGVKMPVLALGTYLGFGQSPDEVKKINDELQEVVESAIDLGYRHIDTAPIYNTEEGVGRGVGEKINKGQVTREDIFITTKLWNTDHDDVRGALKESLSKLNMTHVDLYLIHWPVALNKNYTNSDKDYLETWADMEAVYQEGLAKSIGVSNFNISQMSRLLENCKVKPAALQIEVHPNLIQKELLEFCKKHEIIVMAYSPFGPLVSRFGMELPPPKIDDPILTEIANKYGKNTTQVVLRWLIDRETVPLPKTVNPKRLAENINVFDFKLDHEDIEKINAFDIKRRYTAPSFWQQHKHYPFEKVDNPISNPFS